MKSKIYAVLLFMATFTVSCSEEYDDTDLRNDITDLENRVQALEELCKAMNTNISSLQTLVDALQGNDYITNITPVTSGGEEIGYTIGFSHHAPITIYNGEEGKSGTAPKLRIENNYWYISYDDGSTWEQLAPSISDNVQMPELKIENGYWHVSYDGGQTWEQLDQATGENGQDGSTPQIAIRQDTDGIYYWTLDGEWMLDSADNKIPAQGSKGEEGESGTDGITPKLKIENGYWYVSYDNEASWTELGPAVEDSGDSMFESIDTSDEDYVTFRLSNGELLRLPRYQELDIIFETEDLQRIGILSGVPIRIPFHTVGITSVSNAYITFIASDNLDVIFTGNVKEGGEFTVTTTVPMGLFPGASLLVFLSCNEKTVVKGLSFQYGGIEPIDGNIYYVDSKEQSVSITVASDLNHKYTVEGDAVSWITPVQTRESKYENYEFHVSQNTGAARYGVITFSDYDNVLQKEVYIAQGGNTDESEYIEIQGEQAVVDLDKSPSPIDLAVAFQKADRDGVRHFILKGEFGKLGVRTEGVDVFNPLQSARNVKTVDLSQVRGWDKKMPDGLFSSSGTIDGGGTLRYFNSLKNVVLPDEVVEIGNTAFRYCHNLERINLDNIVRIGESAFWECEKLKEVNSPQLTVVGNGAFVGCSALTSISFPNLTTIPGSLFDDCTSLASANLPNVTEFGECAFRGCTSLSELRLTSPDDFKNNIDYLLYIDFDETITVHVHLYLNRNKQEQVSDGNVWQGVAWKEISFE